jgi:hypothetical protein
MTFDFDAFMRERFPDAHISYREEWENRIKNGTAWAMADMHTKDALLRNGYEVKQ